MSFGEIKPQREFVKEVSWNQWPAAVDSQDPEDGTRHAEDRSSRGIGITGLEHLLRGPIQMDTPLTTDPCQQGNNDDTTQGRYTLVDETADTATLLQVFTSSGSSCSTRRETCVSVQHKHHSSEPFNNYQGVYNVTDKADFNTLVNTSINSYIGMASDAPSTSTTAGATRSYPQVASNIVPLGIQSGHQTYGDRTQIFDADMDLTQCLNASAGCDDVFVSPLIKKVDSKSFLTQFMGGTSQATINTPGDQAFGDRTQILDTDMDFTQCLNASNGNKCDEVSPTAKTIDFSEFLGSRLSNKSPTTTPSGDGDRTIYFDANKTGAEDDIEFTTCLKVSVHGAKDAAINKENVDTPLCDQTVVFGNVANDSMADMDLTGVVNVNIAADRLMSLKMQRDSGPDTRGESEPGMRGDSGSNTRGEGGSDTRGDSRSDTRGDSGSDTRGASPDRMVKVESTGCIAAVSDTSAPWERNVPKSRSHKADMTTYGGEKGFTSGMDFTTCVGTLNPRLTGAG
ncbi:hypothetical protein LSAT2_030231 [Lamellibrachia satsuma]|nr:hypothetical protein LSAT2_030231 [Lamellibrachia satsuma]